MLLNLTMALAIVAGTGLHSSSPVDVLTNRYNNSRTAANLNETILNTSNVNASTFGMLFSRTVDAQIYAQPIVVTGLTFKNGSTHDVVYVCTSNNTIYAFDADSASDSAPLWSRNFGTPIPTSDYNNTTLMYPSIGIVSTPVVDKAAGTIFLVTHTKINGVYAEDIHGLNLLTGQERPHSPHLIEATVYGNGAGSNGTHIQFNPFLELNRPALTLDSGRVYVAFGSHGDQDPYHGWLFAFDETSMDRLAVYCDTPHGSEGGVWMSGGGPVIDSSGNIIFMSGNGSIATDSSGSATGNSFVKLQYSNENFKLLDFFSPYNSAQMNDHDLDLGSTGPMLLPGTTTLLGAGKDGSLFVVNANNMGKFNATTDKNLQRIAAFPDKVFGGFACWQSPDLGLCAYVWGASDYLKRYKVTNGLLTTTPSQESSLVCPNDNPGGVPVISANGSTAGTGILWATVPTTSTSGGSGTIPGELCAYDATNITTPLWTSETNSSRDSFGNLAKFCPPVVANGKVYMATFSNKLVVYGLLPTTPVASVAVNR